MIDSYAWIEYFLGTKMGEVTRRYLDNDPVTPSIVLAEIARKYLREGVGEERIRSRLNFISTKSEVHEISVDGAVLAARAYFELVEKSRRERLDMPGLADGLILSVARALKSQVLTGDPHFQGLSDTIFLG